MKQFRDSEGRPWDIAINAGTVEAVYEETKFYLPGFFRSKEAFEEYPDFLEGPKFPAVLYILVKSQAEKKQISAESFKAALDGDAVEAAIAVFQEELINFFPKSKRETLRKTLMKMQEIGEAMTKVGTAKIDAVNVDEEIAKAMKDIENGLTTLSGSTPASSDSTLDPSPSARSTA